MSQAVANWTKRQPSAPAGLYLAEAAGLDWLRVPGGVSVVDVVEATADSITLAKVVTAAPTRAAARAFGETLAITHDAGATRFGAAPDGYSGPSFIADLPMPTEPGATWGAFYADQRVLHYARQAASQLEVAGCRLMDALAERLADGDFDDDAPPARLHGDLWSGNVLYDAGGAVLIDPSAHGGHRITDLAMLSLFGAPHLDTVLDAYEQASVYLPTGWRELIGLHQVYPLLVHTVLFSGSYAGAAISAARKYIR